MKKKLRMVVFGAFLAMATPVGATDMLITPEILPVQGMVTMIDLGASACIPCKMMAPILEEVATEYKGTAAVVFIDVWKRPEEAKKFKVGMIPTQIFYDKNGKEMYRHAGFMDKKAIAAQLAKLGAGPAKK